MEKEIDEKLDDLLKYVPFIDFIIDIDKHKYAKFIDIRSWILNKKRYPLNDLIKIEKSIKTQYRNLTECTDKKIPTKILNIFKNEINHQYIDLCSEDERKSTKQKHTTHSKKDDDDLEIVYISYPEKPKTKHTKKSSTNTFPKIEKISNGLDALDNDSSHLLKQIDQLSSQDNNSLVVTDYNDDLIWGGDVPINVKEEILFERRDRDNQIFQRREKKNPTKISVPKETISLDSSDEETPNIKLEKIVMNYNHVSMPRNNTVPANKETCLIAEEDNNVLKIMDDTEKLTEISKSTEESNKSSGQEEASLENLLNNHTITTGEKKDGNIEKLLHQLITLLQKKTAEHEDDECPEAPSLADARSISPPLTNVCPISPPLTDTYPISQPINQQSFHNDIQSNMASSGMPQQPPPTSLHQPYVGETSYYTQFQKLAHQRKLNLNDPRIRNELNKYKNSPLLSAGGIDLSCLGNNAFPQATHNNHHPANHQYNFYSTSDNNHSLRYQYPVQNTEQPTYGHTNQNPNYRSSYRRPPINTGPSMTKSSITYAEYKRRKAEEEQKKIEREQQRVQAVMRANRETNVTTSNVETTLPAQRIPFSASQTNTPNDSRGDPTKNVPVTNSEAKKVTDMQDTPATADKNNRNGKTGTEIQTVEDKECKTSEDSKLDESNSPSKEKSRSKKSTEFDRILKELDQIKPVKKRPSSINARLAINKQLEDERQDKNETSPKATSNKSMPKTPTTRSKSSPCEEKSMPKTPTTKSKCNLFEDATDDPSIPADKTNTKKRKQNVPQEINTSEQSRSEKVKTSTAKNLKRRKTIDEPPSKEQNTTSKNSATTLSSNTTTPTVQKQPKLLLKRLTENEIKSCTNTKQKASEDDKSSKNLLDVELVECRTIARTINEDVQKSVKPKKPNNDIQMTEGSTRKCALCTTRPADLTNHYIRKHKTESYTSRLTLSQLEDLSSNIRFVEEQQQTNGNKRQIRYSVVCPFCDDDLIDNFINFYQHYSTHTGEYAYQCSHCKFSKPFKADIQSHQLHSKVCRAAYVQIMYRYHDDAMSIYLHYCKICNFVQLNEANIFKHLRDHHDPRQAVAANVDKCILAAICEKSEDSLADTTSNTSVEDEENVKTQKTAADVRENEMIEKKETNPSTISDDNIPVHNEPFSEDLYDMTLQNLEERLKELHEEKPSAAAVSPRFITTVHSFPCNDNTLHQNNDTIATTKDCKTEDFIMNICKSEPNYDELLPTPPFPLPTNTNSHQYRHYPKNVNYFGLYKCLADDCYYSTNSSREYIEHLEDHRNEDNNSIISCPYCNLHNPNLTSQQLVAHISHYHANMIFQCSICCYRSCDASNVAIHQRGGAHEMNDSETCVIYKCSDLEISCDPVYLRRKVAENVRKLICLYCNQELFYHANLLEHHLAMVHNISINKPLEYYSCIYCTSCVHQDKDILRQHLALQHPEEFPFICDHNELVVNLNDDIVDNLRTINLNEDVQVIDINKASQNSQVDVKPNAEELLKLQEENLKIRLLKLTRNTGVAPDCLYHCSIETCGRFFSNYDLWIRHMRLRHMCLECLCPHCSNGKNSPMRSLSDFKYHFEEHRRHTFVCYNCPLTFAGHQGLEEHVQEQHNNLGEMRFEKIAFNFNYSYHIAIQKNLVLERSEFIANCLSRLEDYIKVAELNESKKLKCNWSIDCHQQTVLSWLHECGVCLPPHGNLSICGVCCKTFYHSHELRTHTKANHANRDVHITNITCQKENKKFYHNLALVFADNHITFSTMRNCFCCEEQNMDPLLFSLHLKNYHKLVLNYYCECCDKPLESIKHAAGHFQQNHQNDKIRIRCVLSSAYEVNIISIRDFKVHIANHHHREVADSIVVKEEKPDDGYEADNSHTDVMLLDEDDVIIESYEKHLKNVENSKEKPRLKCIAMENLLIQTTEKSPPQQEWTSCSPKIFEETSDILNKTADTKEAMLYQHYSTFVQPQLYTTLPSTTTATILPTFVSHVPQQQVIPTNVLMTTLNNSILTTSIPHSIPPTITYSYPPHNTSNALPPFWP
ncbi:uncharacterized protein [Musca autumnalis]|uniref:uncharacterized protein n=1 Tax=Musca autumnalis TaxID=221902 RepID=UPI003CEE0868